MAVWLKSPPGPAAYGRQRIAGAVAQGLQIASPTGEHFREWKVVLRLFIPQRGVCATPHTHLADGFNA